MILQVFRVVVDVSVVVVIDGAVDLSATFVDDVDGQVSPYPA